MRSSPAERWNATAKSNIPETRRVIGRVSLGRAARPPRGRRGAAQSSGRGLSPPRVGRADSGFDDFLPLQQVGAILEASASSVKNSVRYLRTSYARQPLQAQGTIGTNVLPARRRRVRLTGHSAGTGNARREAVQRRNTWSDSPEENPDKSPLTRRGNHLPPGCCGGREAPCRACCATRSNPRGRPAHHESAMVSPHRGPRGTWSGAHWETRRLRRAGRSAMR